MVGTGTSTNGGTTSTNRQELSHFVVIPKKENEELISPIRLEESSFKPSPRPTRESVLQRLYEALMRRSLTKVRSEDTDKNVGLSHQFI